MNYNSFQKKIFAAAALSVAGVLAAGSALAQPAPGRFARGVRAAMATLDLTDAQKEKVRAIFASHKDEGMAFRAVAKANRQALKTAASAPNADPAAVGAAFLKVRGDREAGVAKLKAVREEIDGVLTADQRSRLEGWIAAHRQERGLRHGAPAEN